MDLLAKQCWGGGAGGQNSVYTQGQFEEFCTVEQSEEVSDIEDEWDSIEFDGETLEFSSTPVHSVHKYATFQASPVAGFDGEAVACLGASYGFMWGPSCEEISKFGVKFKKTAVLVAAIENSTGEYCGIEDLPKLGLELIGDLTDDGHNWVVVDAAKFLAFAALCETAQSSCDLDPGELDEEDFALAIIKNITETP